MSGSSLFQKRKPVMSNLSVNIAGQTFTYEGLFNMSGPELVRAHNLAASQVGVTPTKRFSNKVQAVKRTWEVLSKVAKAVPEATKAPEAATAPAPAPAPAPEKLKKEPKAPKAPKARSEEHTSELQSRLHR